MNSTYSIIHVSVNDFIHFLAKRLYLGILNNSEMLPENFIFDLQSVDLIATKNVDHTQLFARFSDTIYLISRLESISNDRKLQCIGTINAMTTTTEYANYVRCAYPIRGYINNIMTNAYDAIMNIILHEIKSLVTAYDKSIHNINANDFAHCMNILSTKWHDELHLFVIVFKFTIIAFDITNGPLLNYFMAVNDIYKLLDKTVADYNHMTQTQSYNLFVRHELSGYDNYELIRDHYLDIDDITNYG